MRRYALYRVPILVLIAMEPVVFLSPRPSGLMRVEV